MHRTYIPATFTIISFFFRLWYRRNQQNVLCIDQLSAVNESLDTNEIVNRHTLYPYNSIELAVVLVYGTDLKRRKDILYIPDWVRYLGFWIVFFWISFALILCVIRRRIGIANHGIISTLIESAVPFIGVGTIQMDHRWEKIFFGMLLMLGVVTNPLWSDIFLVQTYQIMDEKISTFEQLSKIQSPIYLYSSLEGDTVLVNELIRYTHQHIKNAMEFLLMKYIHYN